MTDLAASHLPLEVEPSIPRFWAALFEEVPNIRRERITKCEDTIRRNPQPIA